MIRPIWPCLPLRSGAAVQRLEMLRHEIGVDIAARIGHLAERGGVARHHQHARAGRNKDQLVGARAVLDGKLLRHRPAPADAHDVDQGHLEPVEQQRRNPRHQDRVVRHHRVGRSPDTRHVKGDEVAVIKRLGQWRNSLDIRADAVEEQYGELAGGLRGTPDGNAQNAAIDGFHAVNWLAARWSYSFPLPCFRVARNGLTERLGGARGFVTLFIPTL